MILLADRAFAVACRGHHELVLENIALRQQLAALKRSVARPHLRRRDRLFWIALAAVWTRWRSALMFVQPDTVVRWHRECFRWRWTRRSRGGAGRPRTIDAKTRALVRDLAAANPLWGAPRIHGELRTLGIDISERSVSRLLRRRRRPPSQTWRTFLTNHLASTASMDFFTVPTVTGRVLFVRLVLSHRRRRVVHFNVTEHPTAEWTTQQIVDAFPDDTAPSWLLWDRDSIYSDAFRRRVASMAITEVASSPASPWQNPFVERLIGSIRRECLDHLIIFNATHLRRALTAYFRYYHRTRTHLGLKKDAPDHRPPSNVSAGRILAVPEVGGLHHRYERRAA
jgi:putative transposase